MHLYLLIVTVAGLLAPHFLGPPQNCAVRAGSHLADYEPGVSSSSFGEPVFRLQPPAVINFANTRGATILCLASGSPRPTISWFSSFPGSIELGGGGRETAESPFGGSSELPLHLLQSRPVTNVTHLREIVQNGAAIRLLPFKEADFRPDIHSTEYRCTASNHLATIHSRSVQVQAVMSSSELESMETPPTAKVSDEFVALGSPAVLKCRPNGSSSSSSGGAGSAQFSHLIEWFTSDGLEIGAGETSRGNKFTAFKSGELHVASVEMADLQRTYGCRLRNSVTGQLMVSSGLAQLILTHSPAPSSPPLEPHEGAGKMEPAGPRYQLLGGSPQVLHSTSQLIALDPVHWLRHLYTRRHSLVASMASGARDPSHQQLPHQSHHYQTQLLQQLEGHQLDEELEWRLLLPCAVRVATTSAAELPLRWLYLPPTGSGGSSNSGKPLAAEPADQHHQKPIPLEQWAASKSIALQMLSNQTHQQQNSGAPQLATIGSSSSGTPNNLKRGAKLFAAGGGGDNPRQPASRFVVGPTYLAIEWPTRAQSGRYISQLPDGRTMCDINVIIRQPMRLKMEASLGGTNGDRMVQPQQASGEFSLPMAQLAADSSGEEPSSARSHSWFSRAADWLGWPAAAGAPNTAPQGTTLQGTGSSSSKRRRWAPSETQASSGSTANPLLDEDPRRIQVHGQGVVAAPPIALVGQRLQLDCYGSGHPIERVKWFKNGQAINTQSSSDFQMEIVNSGVPTTTGTTSSTTTTTSTGLEHDNSAAPTTLLTSLVIRQVQPRDVGLLVFECFGQNSLGDRARAGLAVFVAERHQVEWARGQCPIQQQATGNLSSSSSSLLYSSSSSFSENDNGEEGESDEEANEQESARRPPVDYVEFDGTGFAGWSGVGRGAGSATEQRASSAASGGRRASALFRRHNPMQRALLLENEPVELLCPIETRDRQPNGSRVHQQQQSNGGGGSLIRVDWRRWSSSAPSNEASSSSSATTTAAAKQQQQQMTESQARNFNQLFSGDSRFVINGSSLQIRSLSKRHDEALYVCRPTLTSELDVALGGSGGSSSSGQQTAAAAAANANESGATDDGGSNEADEAGDAEAGGRGRGSSAAGSLAVHQSSLASSSPSCSALLAASMFQAPQQQQQQSPLKRVSAATRSIAPMSSISIRIVAKPKIDPFEFSRNLEEGMRAVAVCAVISGQSPVDINWFKDGELLLADEQVSLDQSNGFSSTLTFHRIRPAHSGLYTCVAANAFAAANYSSRLLVNVAPYFIEPPKSTQAVLNSNVLVNCRAGGQPSPQIRWRKLVAVNGGGGGANKLGLVAPPSGSSISSSGSGKLEAGGYRPTTINELDSHQMAAPAPAQSAASIVGSSGSNIIDASMVAAAANNNKYEFRIITSNSHIQILENGSMIIKEVELSDSSRYVCQAFNGINPSLSEVIDLIVLSPAQFDVNYETISVKRDSMIKFNCAPRGDQPMRIEWHKEGQPLVANSNNYHSSQDPAKRQQQQEQTKYSEIAYFAQSATGNNGTGSGNNNNAGDQPQRQRHSNLVLQRPPSSSTMNRSTMGADGGGEPGLRSSELFINYADRADTGTFVCVARNAYGRDELTYRLIVQEAPDVPLNVNVQNVQANSLKLLWTAPFDGNLALSHFVIEYRKVQGGGGGGGSSSSSGNSGGGGLSTKPITSASGDHQSLESRHSEWARLVVSTNKLNSDPLSSSSSSSLSLSQPMAPLDVGGGPTSAAAGRSTATAAAPTYGIVLRQFSAKSTYHIRVAAVNAIGQSGFSPHLTVTTAEEPPNSRANDLRAQPISSSSIRVLWRGPAIVDEQAPIKGYYLSHRKFQPLAGGAGGKEDPSSPLLAVTAGSSSNGNVHQQQPNLWLATSSISAANTTTADENLLLLAGGGAGAGGGGGSSLGAGLGGKYTNGGGGGSRASAGLFADANYEFLLSSLEKNTKYEIRVQPYNSMGVGPSSDTVGQTLKFDRPGQPSLKLVAARRQSIELKWTLADDEQPLMGFSVFFKCEYDEWQEIQLGIIHHYVIENLRCGNKYQIYLSAFNVVGRSDPSEVLSVRTEGTVPVAPDKDQFFRSNITEVVLDMSGWQSGGCPISSFTIQFKRLHESNWFFLSESSTQFTNSDKITIPDLTPATWYKLLVTADNEAGRTNAEYLFSTLNTNGEQIAPAFPLEHELTGHGSRQQQSSGDGAGRSMLSGLNRYLFPGAGRGQNTSGEGHLLLPMSCVLLLLVVSLASYLYYSQRGSSSSASSNSSSASSSGGASNRSAKGVTNLHHHHQQQQRRHHHHNQNGSASLSRAPSLLMNQLAQQNCDSTTTTLARVTAFDEKQLIQSNGHHLHPHLMSHALPLDANGGCGQSPGAVSQRQTLSQDDDNNNSSMLESFIVNGTLQSFVGGGGGGTGSRAQQQRGGSFMKLLPSGNSIFGNCTGSQAAGSSGPSSNCTNSSSLSTHSTNCGFDGASSHGSSSGGPALKAKLQLIDESSLISGPMDLDAPGDGGQQQQQQSSYYAGTNNNNLLARTSIYSGLRSADCHVDVINHHQAVQQPHHNPSSSQTEAEPATIITDSSCLFNGHEAMTSNRQLYGFAANQRLLSSSFASAADLLQRQQQQQQLFYQHHQQQQQHQHQHQAEEPIYQRLDKFQAYGLPSSMCKQPLSSQFGTKSQTLRFNTHLSSMDDSTMKSAATMQRHHAHHPSAQFQQQQQQLQLDSNQQQYLAGFYPPPPPSTSLMNPASGELQLSEPEQQQQQQQQPHQTTNYHGQNFDPTSTGMVNNNNMTTTTSSEIEQHIMCANNSHQQQQQQPGGC